MTTVLPAPLITCRQLIDLLAGLEAEELDAITAAARAMGGVLLEQEEAVERFGTDGEAMLRHLARCVSACRAYLITYHDTTRLVHALAAIDTGFEPLPDEVIARMVEKMRE